MIIEIREIHSRIRDEIEERLAEFDQLMEHGTDEDLFQELAFCLLTPQSRARSCWNAVRTLRQNGLLMEGDASSISSALNGIRFRNKKAEYIVMSRSVFSTRGRLNIRQTIQGFRNSRRARDWLVSEVKGMGYKEASHFLRNIGMGDDLAILDRHVLRALRALGVILKVPSYIPRRKYLEIEDAMRSLSISLGIPMNHLDLVLWYRETGDIFK